MLAFTWGVVTGVYHTFPFSWVYFAKHELARTLQNAWKRPSPKEQSYSIMQPIYTGLLNFDLTIVPGIISGEAGGGLAVVPGGLLIGRDTRLYYFDEKRNQLVALSWMLPSHDREQVTSQTYDGRAVRPSDMRYHDIEVASIGGQQHLFVTYNKFDSLSKCFYFRLDGAVLPEGWQKLSQDYPSDLKWREIFRAKPCLPPSLERYTFGGSQGGGRIVAKADRLLVSTGDLEFDGIGSKQPVVSQIDGSDYGRVFELRPSSHQRIELSRGHRNPQGLAFDKDGNLWLAEHGPMGGDELNLVQQGANYGWPLVTLGVSYTDFKSDAKNWPAKPNQGPHSSFQIPMFAWMPAIAPSSLALVEGIDRRWDGDLLVGTLIDESLHRMRLEGTRVLYDEKIPLHRRVRDVAVSNGLIYLLFDDGRFGYMTPHRMADANTMETESTRILSDAGCLVCHSKSSAPRLVGLLGRDIASQPNVEYSVALRSVPGQWTKEKLIAFLRSPAKFAPGTTMPEPSLDHEALARLIEELRDGSEPPDLK